MSARSLNKVHLIGNLTRDPELRYTPQGTPVCTFGVATNREWTDQSGQKQEETEFHRIVSWQKLAELCSQLLFKGRKVYVDGRLQTRRWTGQDEQERQTTEVVIDNMIILDSRRGEGVGGMRSEPGVMPGRTGEAQITTTDKKAPVVTDKPSVKKTTDDKKKSQVKAEPKAKSAAKKAPAKKGKPGETSEEVKADDIPF